MHRKWQWFWALTLPALNRFPAPKQYDSLLVATFFRFGGFTRLSILTGPVPV